MKKLKIYLDNCCFNRPYDNQDQLSIRLESEAKISIQESIKNHKINLAWSYILDLENNNNPFEEKKIEIKLWKKIASSSIAETEEILSIMTKIRTKHIKPLDALHIACAIVLNCDYFITVDKGILKKADKVEEIKILNPIEFIYKMEDEL
jgi:predicted nucleic acid-binding protein